MSKKRLIAYFDGSNFYHCAKNNYGITNINFLDLTNRMIDSNKEELIKIKYFNAPINKQEDPKGYAEQQKFLSHLRAIPIFDVNLGHLVKRPLNKIHINCPSCGHQIVDELKCPKCNRIISIKNCNKVTEKGVDVRLAVNMLLDAIENKYDVALLFSSDADFAPAIKYIIKTLKKEIIYCRFPQPKTYELIQVCSDKKMITKDIIEDSRLY